MPAGPARTRAVVCLTLITVQRAIARAERGAWAIGVEPQRAAVPARTVPRGTGAASARSAAEARLAARRHAHARVHMYARTLTHTHTHKYKHTRTHTRARTPTHTHTHAHTHTRARTHARAHTRARMRARMRARTRAPRRRALPPVRLQCEHSVQHALAAENHQPVFEGLYIEAVEGERIQPKLTAISLSPVGIQVKNSTQNSCVRPARRVMMHWEGTAPPC
jgi:hypothetical protein